MKGMKILLLLAVVSIVVFGAGCVGQDSSNLSATTVGSGQEAAEVVTDISDDVVDISDIIDDVDTSLG